MVVFDNAGLTKSLMDVKESHGTLVNYKSQISTLVNMDIYSVARKFASLGNTGGRRWYLDSDEFTEYDLLSWLENLRNYAQVLKSEMNVESEIEMWLRATIGKVFVSMDSLSSIANAMAVVTNNFISDATHSFEGTGLRSGKNDGIVEAISEVIEVELENVEEIKHKIQNLSDVAGIVAKNFTEMDHVIQGK